MSLLKKTIFPALLSLALLGCGNASGTFLATNDGKAAPLPDSIKAVMAKPRYAKATWSLLVTDVQTGQSFYQLNATRRSFTGSCRKLFSVGLALTTLGADHRQVTRVYRQGTVSSGTLNGNLVLVASGDLAFGGRRIDADTIEVTNFDHNDANSLGSAVLTPQDPLFALDQLAAQIKASGIDTVNGGVAVDDRLFESYRVPNGNLLITPIMLNENQIDVTVTPTTAGNAATVVHRPTSQFFSVTGNVTTGAAGSAESIAFSGNRLTNGVGDTGQVTGSIPLDYSAPLTHLNSYVGTFRVEDPAAFARVAFAEALARHGVTVTQNALTASAPLPTTPPAAADQVASYTSAPYSETARLILKVSLNLGANAALSLFGLEKGERTISGALAAERTALTQQYGLDPDSFNFPTNGSGSPDSEASPTALVHFLIAMNRSTVATQYLRSLPILGVDGSLASTGTTLPGKGHVFAKTGTTVAPDSGGDLQLKAQCLAGYIETKSGRKVAYALMVNDAGPVTDIETDVGGVFEDEGVISSLIYESL